MFYIHTIDIEYMYIVNKPGIVSFFIYLYLMEWAKLYVLFES